MGNNQKNKPRYEPSKFFAPVRDRTIILHNAYKFNLKIGDVIKFPHNFESLRLWDANIILSRYIILNNFEFKDKEVLQLASGTGIGGISLKKWTKAKNIIMTQQTEEAIVNIKKNMIRNEIKDLTAVLMKWSEYNNFEKQYEVILAADPFFHGCSFQNIYNIMMKFLVSGGKIIICVVDQSKINQFCKVVQDPIFLCQKVSLINEEYLTNPLFNKVQGAQEFTFIAKGQFFIYAFTKKKVLIQESVMIKEEVIQKQLKFSSQNDLHTKENQNLNSTIKKNQSISSKKSPQNSLSENNSVKSSRNQSRQKSYHSKISGSNLSKKQSNKISIKKSYSNSLSQKGSDKQYKSNSQNKKLAHAKSKRNKSIKRKGSFLINSKTPSMKQSKDKCNKSQNSFMTPKQKQLENHEQAGVQQNNSKLSQASNELKLSRKSLSVQKVSKKISNSSNPSLDMKQKILNKSRYSKKSISEKKQSQKDSDMKSNLSQSISSCKKSLKSNNSVPQKKQTVHILQNQNKSVCSNCSQQSFQQKSVKSSSQLKECAGIIKKIDKDSCISENSIQSVQRKKSKNHSLSKSVGSNCSIGPPSIKKEEKKQTEQENLHSKSISSKNSHN